jgi:polyhydroxyalkanoate synthase subunit PhaC
LRLGVHGLLDDGKQIDGAAREAVDAIQESTGEREANVIGYCLGGTLLASTLAYMAVKRDTRIKSATYFVAMVDFAEAGELSVFIDEEQLAALEEPMNARAISKAAPWRRPSTCCVPTT